MTALKGRVCSACFRQKHCTGRSVSHDNEKVFSSKPIFNTAPEKLGYANLCKHVSATELGGEFLGHF